MSFKRMLLGVMLVCAVACSRQESTTVDASSGEESGSPSTSTSGTVTPGSTSPAPTATGTIAADRTPGAVSTQPGVPSGDTPASPQLIAEGESIFRANCQRCHIGEMKSLKTAAVQNQSDAELARTIRGANQMISARGMHKIIDLSETEMSAVVAYIKSLQ